MVSYSDLVFSISPFSYSILLTTREWHDKRSMITLRDNYACTVCGKGSTMPHYDIPSRKTYHLWFGDETIKYVQRADGKYEEQISQEIIHSTKPYCLQVHHRFYISGHLPWEYEDDALITMCNWCHSAFHESNSVTVYIGSLEQQVTSQVCKRCDGSGWFQEYTHIQNGVCFQCNGAGYDYSNIAM